MNTTDTTSHVETYRIADGLDVLALDADLESRLRDTLAYGENYDADIADAVTRHIEDSITAKLQEHRVDTHTGEWFGEWSAADIVRAALDQHAA